MNEPSLFDICHIGLSEEFLFSMYLSCQKSDHNCSAFHGSADSKCREESAKLLGCLIRNCERLIVPYIAPIHKVSLVM